VRQHLLFNAGRVLSYATLGVAFGALGMAVFDAAAVVALADGVRAVTGIAAGVAIVFVGVGYLRSGHGPSAGRIPLVGGLVSRATAALTGRVDTWVAGPRIVALGAVHGLLPCPVLYPAYLYAFAVGSPLRGGVSLAVLGLGTVPTLLAYGTVFGSLGVDTRRRLHRALGLAFVALGYLPLAHGLGLAGVDLPMPAVPVFRPL
jgi:sulfite exporter TauE/SafE